MSSSHKTRDRHHLKKTGLNNMSYSYTQNQQRSSKDLETPVTRSADAGLERITEEFTGPVEIKSVDLVGASQGWFYITVFNRQYKIHRERIYLETFDKAGPSFQLRQLLAAVAPSTLTFMSALDETGPKHLLTLVGLRCEAEIKRRAGVLVKVNSQGRYTLVKWAPQQPDHETLRTNETFGTRQLALGWADDHAVPYAYLTVSRWVRWHEADEHNYARSNN